jgi:large conductance mechanosensitive channel
MLTGFKAFISRGNVIDLAVAVIIGAAFTKIITSLTEDVIMPAIGFVTGGADFSAYFLRLGPVPAGFRGDPGSYAALKAAGVPMIGYGALITAAVQFLIVAFIIYLLVWAIKRLIPDKDVPAASEPAEVALLREIRDELRQRPAAAETLPVTSH